MGHKILVVDDDHDQRELYVSVLLDGDMLICTAVNGRDGVNAYRESFESDRPNFDLVIMDGEMPVMDGYDATAAITELDPEARVVMLSWAPDDNEARSRGALAAHTKTFDRDDLRRIICQYLDSCGDTEAGDDVDDPDDTDVEPTEVDAAEDSEDREGWPGDEPFPTTPVEETKLELEPLPLSYVEKAEAAEKEKRAETLAGIRQLCDIFEEHDDIPLPYAFNDVSIFLTSDGASTMKRMTSIRRRIGGKWEKKPWAEYFDIVCKVRGVTVKLTSLRKDVCQRVVTGTRTSVVEVPDPELVAKVPLKRVESTIEDVEWVCPESLLSD